jgi:hypothetical protein
MKTQQKVFLIFDMERRHAVANYQLVVLTNPVAGREDEYNVWYNEQHLHDVLAVPGFVGAQRFAAVDQEAKLSHKYLAIYEMETDDLKKTMKQLNAAAGTFAMLISDAMDVSTISATVFGPITPKLRANN